MYMYISWLKYIHTYISCPKSTNTSIKKLSHALFLFLIFCLFFVSIIYQFNLISMYLNEKWPHTICKKEKMKRGKVSVLVKISIYLSRGKDQHFPKIPRILSSLRVMSCNFLFTKNGMSFPLSPHFSYPLTHHPLELISDPFIAHRHAVALLCWHVGGASPLARVGLLVHVGVLPSNPCYPFLLHLVLWCVFTYLFTFLHLASPVCGMIALGSTCPFHLHFDIYST